MTLLGKSGARHFVCLHRAVLRHLERSSFRRVEMAVDPRCAVAVRWARLLGFAPEGVMTGFFPDGLEAVRFARVHPLTRMH